MALDVTVTSTVAYTSGIQRLVRDVAGNLPDEWTLVRFDPRSATFRKVEQVPPLIYRNQDSFSERWRAKIREFLALIAYQTSDHPKLWLPHSLRSLARRFFMRYLAEAFLDDDPKWRAGPQWSPQSGDRFLTMEIVTDRRHRDAIRSLQERNVVSSCYVHDLIPLTHPEFFSRQSLHGLRAEFLDYAEIALRSDNLVANSQSTLNEFSILAQLLAPSHQQKRCVVYPAVKSPALAATEIEDDPLVAPPPDGTIRILGIGPLDERKNFQVAVRALLVLHSMGQKATLTLISGAGRRIEPRISSLISRMPESQRAQLYLLSGLSEAALEREYALADVVVVPSRAEGFGIPIIEAAARRLPIVANDLPVFREVATGLPIVYANADDPVAWAQAILKVSSGALPHDMVAQHANPGLKTVAEFSQELFGET